LRDGSCAERRVSGHAATRWRQSAWAGNVRLFGGAQDGRFHSGGRDFGSRTRPLFVVAQEKIEQTIACPYNAEDTQFGWAMGVLLGPTNIEPARISGDIDVECSAYFFLLLSRAVVEWSLA